MAIATFLIPSELGPGISRHNVGFFVPGQTFTLPDTNTARLKKAGHTDKPNKHLIPLNEEAVKMLKKAWPEEEIAPIPENASDAAQEVVDGPKNTRESESYLSSLEEAEKTGVRPGTGAGVAAPGVAAQAPAVVKSGKGSKGSKGTRAADQ